MPSETPKLKAPGLKLRRNRDGTVRLYWGARADAVKGGYRPETVRLHYDHTDAAQWPLIEAACNRLQAEMKEWTSGYRRDPMRFDGTIKGLVKPYETDPSSPYAQVKWNTKRTYGQQLDKIEKAFGARVLGNLAIADFRRWYDEAKKSKVEGEPERITKAHNLMRMVRRLLSYGVMAELAECERLQKIMGNARFKAPGRRRAKLELRHVIAFIAGAKAAGRLSLALGTALQFETGMRQKDVIGEWEPIPAGAAPHGIVLQGRRWVNGLTWSDIGARLIISKETTKTGAIVSHDLNLCPMTLDLLQLTGAGGRIGPLIIDETAGRPYAEWSYAREWRVIARLAKIPDAIWNMDARAGAITEAEDAGADLDEIRGAVGHTQSSTTARYSRGAIGKSRSVAIKRAAHRTMKEQE